MSEEKKAPKVKKWKVKDEHFNKSKSLLNKGNKGVKIVPCSYRKIAMDGKHFKFEKGQILTKEELSAFDSEAKKHWLTNA